MTIDMNTEYVELPFCSFEQIEVAYSNGTKFIVRNIDKFQPVLNITFKKSVVGKIVGMRVKAKSLVSAKDFHINYFVPNGKHEDGYDLQLMMVQEVKDASVKDEPIKMVYEPLPFESFEELVDVYTNKKRMFVVQVDTEYREVISIELRESYPRLSVRAMSGASVALSWFNFEPDGSHPFGLKLLMVKEAEEANTKNSNAPKSPWTDKDYLGQEPLDIYRATPKIDRFADLFKDRGGYRVRVEHLGLRVIENQGSFPVTNPDLKNVWGA